MVMQERHRDLYWFGQEKALRPAGGMFSIVLQLSACTGVNTSGYCRGFYVLDGSDVWLLFYV